MSSGKVGQEKGHAKFMARNLKRWHLGISCNATTVRLRRLVIMRDLGTAGRPPALTSHKHREIPRELNRIAITELQ
jgi:hypothetical protein